MKSGMVAQIRVNPSDCQSILDIMGVLGVDPYDGRSFAVCVSLALSSMIGMVKKAGVIGEPDSFQFLNRMAPFMNSKNNRAKYLASDQLYRQVSSGNSIPALEVPASRSHPGQYIPEHLQKPVGWSSKGPSTEVCGELLPDPQVREMMLAEYEELKKVLQDEIPTAEQVERFCSLQGHLFPDA